jgi:hypothetical protein
MRLPQVHSTALHPDDRCQKRALPFRRRKDLICIFCETGSALKM